MDIAFRRAESDEALRLAKIVQETSGGLIDFLLKGVIPFTSPAQILSLQVMADDSPYSYKNIIVAEQDGEIVGLILAYPWDEQGPSEMAKRYLPKKKLDAVGELLSSADPDSLFINTFWVAEAYRGSGLADALLDFAGDWARDMGYNQLSLHAWKASERAIRFYDRHEFKETRAFDIPDHKHLEFKGGMVQLCKSLN